MKMTGANSMTACLLAAVLAVARAAQAGPTDTPLPTFSDGKAAVAVYTAFGVIKHSNLETDFMCTNTGTAAVDIGLEVFDETGALRNSVHTGSGAVLNVGVGQTKTIGTGSTAVLHEDAVISTLGPGGNGTNSLSNGSGRVVATAKSITCTAMLADKLHAIADPTISSVPPPPFTSLPLTPVP